VSDLPRTANYNAYHHITNLTHPTAKRVLQRVVGGLCENNDYFTADTFHKDRRLPLILPGDLLAVHDTGAHCRAMGSNYNGKLRCGEVLLRVDGSVKLIREPEPEAALYAGFNYPGLG
jgi:diaminopimelate decarboxylase